MKPKYAIVYANMFWQHRGGYACTGLTTVPVSCKDEAKKLVKHLFDNTSDIITVIDLETGKPVEGDL